MAEMNPDATARREASRENGRFGVQAHTSPEVSLPVYVEHETRGLQPGAVVLMELNREYGPFQFAFRSRELRTRWKAAGRPSELTVTGRRRAPEDGHTDDEVTFDLGGEPLVLTFHRDAHFNVRA